MLDFKAFFCIFTKTLHIALYCIYGEYIKHHHFSPSFLIKCTRFSYFCCLMHFLFVFLILIEKRLEHKFNSLIYFSRTDFGKKEIWTRSVSRHINFKDYYGYWHKLGKNDIEERQNVAWIFRKVYHTLTHILIHQPVH